MLVNDAVYNSCAHQRALFTKPSVYQLKGKLEYSGSYDEESNADVKVH